MSRVYLIAIVFRATIKTCHLAILREVGARVSLNNKPVTYPLCATPTSAVAAGRSRSYARTRVETR